MACGMKRSRVPFGRQIWGLPASTDAIRRMTRGWRRVSSCGESPLTAGRSCWAFPIPFRTGGGLHGRRVRAGEEAALDLPIQDQGI
jgi:hypothetical protein